MSKKIEGSWLQKWAWSLDATTASGDYFAIAGTALSCDKETLKENIEWMVENDYGNGEIINFDLILSDPEWNWVDEDVGVIFDEGPTPSYIDGDEPTDCPWNDDGTHVPDDVDFDAGIGKEVLPYNKLKVVADDLFNNVPQEK
jgi:hypothetical protein